MFSSVAKWVTQIDHAKRIPEIVAHAVDVATSGRPGPVVIALSEEMQRDMAEVPDLPRIAVAPASSRSGGAAAIARDAGAVAPAGGGARRLLLDRRRPRRDPAISCAATRFR